MGHSSKGVVEKCVEKPFWESLSVPPVEFSTRVRCMKASSTPMALVFPVMYTLFAGWQSPEAAPTRVNALVRDACYRALARCTTTVNRSFSDPTVRRCIAAGTSATAEFRTMTWMRYVLASTASAEAPLRECKSCVCCHAGARALSLLFVAENSTR